MLLRYFLPCCAVVHAFPLSLEVRCLREECKKEVNNVRRDSLRSFPQGLGAATAASASHPTREGTRSTAFSFDTSVSGGTSSSEDEEDVDVDDDLVGDLEAWAKAGGLAAKMTRLEEEVEHSAAAKRRLEDENSTLRARVETLEDSNRSLASRPTTTLLLPRSPSYMRDGGGGGGGGGGSGRGAASPPSSRPSSPDERGQVGAYLQSLEHQVEARLSEIHRLAEQNRKSVLDHVAMLRQPGLVS